MRLESYYYRLLHAHCDGLRGTFRIGLLGECDVYRGHFPGEAVCPGVFHLQTVKECAERLCGQRLHLSRIVRCRWTALAIPARCPEMEVEVSMQPVGEGYAVTARLYDTTHTYMDFKGEMNL